MRTSHAAYRSSGWTAPTNVRLGLAPPRLGNRVGQVGSIAVAIGLAQAVVAADQTIIPPPGDILMVSLVLEKGGLGGAFGVGGSDWNGDAIVRGSFRDGKLKIPSRLSVRDIVSELAVDGKSVKGDLVWQSVPRRFAEARYTIAAEIANGVVTGTWETVDKAKKGKVTGTCRTEADLRRDNAFTTKADWPSWHGPTTSFAATPAGLTLVSDFKVSRPVWRSEELVPHGNGNALNYANLAINDRTMGGGASPIVVDGKVIVSYYQPTGSEYLAGLADAEAAAKKANLTELSPFMKEKFLVKADDVVVCMDAVTGKTLWKNIFAGKSMNQPSHKGGVVNNTPCAGDGRVFAMGPGGGVRGMELATGKVLWESTGMSAEKVQPYSGARNMCTAPILVGGTLILPDHGSTLTGIDPATGAVLWKLPGKGSNFQVPCRWVHQGRELVISLTAAQGKSAQIVAIDPKTGTVLWSIGDVVAPAKGVSVYGDTLVVLSNLIGSDAVGGLKEAKCTAYRLGDGKPAQLWEVQCPYVTSHLVPAVNDQHVVLGGFGESRLLERATGKELAVYKGPGPGNEGHIFLAEDKVFLSVDGSHGHSDFVVLGGTPATFASGVPWSQPHPQTTSYHNKPMTWPIVEGRLFMRGYDGVYCYDLRKRN